MTHHPDLHLIDVRCTSCGMSFTTRSTAAKLSIDVCSAVAGQVEGNHENRVSEQENDFAEASRSPGPQNERRQGSGDPNRD
jgi:ribosomal protein L31